MSELPCPYCGFNCEISSNVEEKIECSNCGRIFLYIQNSESHGTIDYRPSPEINDRGRQMSELKAISGNEIREDIDYNTKGIDFEDKEWRKYGKELCDTLYYRKSEADKVIADLEESHKKEVGQLLIEIAELKAQKAQAEDDIAFWKAKAKGEM